MTTQNPSAPGSEARARARHFVILLGWVSLFADLCYEGMRGAIGGYLAALGASAAAVGMVAGTGEAIGYGLRYVSGALADRTSLTFVYHVCAFLPAVGLLGGFLPTAPGKASAAKTA